MSDVFRPGLHEPEANGKPITTSLQHWTHGLQRPLKSEVRFVPATRFTSLRRGTRTPVAMRDPEFGPVRLRAFGTQSMRVAELGLSVREIVGTDGELVAEAIEPTTAAYGLASPEFHIQNLFPPEGAERVLHKRTSMRVVGDLDRVAQFSCAEATTMVAANSSGDMGAMIEGDTRASPTSTRRSRT